MRQMGIGGTMGNLLRLMKQLGADAALSREYEADPVTVMTRFQLSDEERDALLNKDFAAIKRLTGLKDGQFATNSTVSAYDSDPAR